MVQIMTGMSSIQEEVTKYLYRWDKYNNIYTLDKDAFIRRFAKANRPLSQFDAEIQKYKDSHSLIQVRLLVEINLSKIVRMFP